MARDEDEVFTLFVRDLKDGAEDESLSIGELDDDPSGLRFVDVDQDGRNDLLLFVRYAPPRTFLQNAAGEFEVFAGQEMSCHDYVAILDSAFSQLTLAFIPPSLDQVLVGSIERSRHPDLKAVFLIGATQRQFPVPVSSDSILADDDRSAAESAGFELAATESRELTERQYLAYIAFTRPSEFLCVTYPLADDSGSAVARSEFIAAVESLFEGLGEESIAGGQVEIEKVSKKYARLYFT